MKENNLSNRIHNGKVFEKQAYEYLKSKFKIVNWLSLKTNKSLYDFECIDDDGNIFYVEAKYSSTAKKIPINNKQKNADYIIFKDKDNLVHFVEHNDFDQFFYLEADTKVISKDNLEKSGGRMREIVKYGYTHAIKLEPADMKDYSLVAGDTVDIEDLTIVKDQQLADLNITRILKEQKEKEENGSKH